MARSGASPSRCCATSSISDAINYHGRIVNTCSADANDPLNAALRLIDPNPTTPQARLLIRLRDAIANDVGEFRIAELSLLDTDTLALAVSLKDAWEASVYTAKQWKRAVRTADWRLRAMEAIARW